MDYNDALIYLEKLNYFGINLGLERITELCRLLDNPEKKYKTIHITGTNGKGSTTFALDKVFFEAGIKSGRYISPHLMIYNERISVNGKNISDEDFARICTDVSQAVNHMVNIDNKEPPTQFEVLTAMAFLYFAEQEVEYAVIEVGLGGLLDSTNVVQPEITIISNVSMEHADKCGGTLENIARHKAGIIKGGVPVVTGATGLPLEIIRSKAAELNSDIFVYGEDFIAELEYAVHSNEKHKVVFQQFNYISSLERKILDPFKISINGTFQIINMSLVIMATDLLAHNDTRINEEVVRKALLHVNIPARFETISNENEIIVIDGAHNPSGILALRDSLDECLPQYRERIFVFGVLKDKDIEQMVHNLINPQDILIAVKPNSDRAASNEVVIAIATAIGAEAIGVDNINMGIFIAREKAKSLGRLMVVCGSLYLVGLARDIIIKTIKN